MSENMTFPQTTRRAKTVVIEKNYCCADVARRYDVSALDELRKERVGDAVKTDVE